MNAIKIKNISFSYQNSKNIILDNCNIDFNTGNIIGLVGSNGSGKTTFLKILSGIQAPSNGKVYYDDQEIKNVKSAKKCVTILPENAKLYLVETKVANEFLRLFNNKNDVLEFLKRFHLEELLNKKIYELSEGQRRLIAIISALNQNKEIFLLDEPTIGLDVFGRNLLFKLLEEIKKQNKIAIIATNDNRILIRVDRIIGLKDGKFLLDASPKEGLLKLEEILGLIPNQISRIVTNLRLNNINVPDIIKTDEFNAYLKSKEQ